MPLIKEKKISINYYKLLPEGAPYQLIKGKLIMTPAPNPVHQIILGRFFRTLSEFVEDKKAGMVLFSPVNLYLNDKNAFQPDIIFLSKDGNAVIKRDGIYGAPDIVIEILSPSTAHYDLREKFKVYERTGVREYWIVDPDMKTVEVYINDGGAFSLKYKVEVKGEVGSTVLENFKIKLEEIFTDLPF